MSRQPHAPPSSTVSIPPHRSSDGTSTTTHQSQTPPPPPRLKTPSFPVREDCWSEEATSTLIEAWGKIYLQLNRGNLRQKHWQEVADAVNARHGHVKKNRRSDVQCKNRIDTLKKKYKVEKSKVLESVTKSNYVSPWPFFNRLDSLIGSTFKPPGHPPPPPKRPRTKRPPPYKPSTDVSFFRRNFSVMVAAAAAADVAEEGSDTSSSFSGGAERGEDVYDYGEVAAAIGRFVEVYARVEEAKRRQVVELEKHRMEFTKDLEISRMKMLMESQVQLEKMKRPKRNSEHDFCRSDNGDPSTSFG